jgi:hypothetical protein
MYKYLHSSGTVTGVPKVFSFFYKGLCYDFIRSIQHYAHGLARKEFRRSICLKQQKILFKNSADDWGADDRPNLVSP